MKSLCLVLLAAIQAWGADMVRHPHKAGWSGSIGLDYDGSRHRTNAFSLGAEVEWGSKENWVSLSFDAYTDWQHHWDMSSDAYATLQLGHALHRDNEARLYLNATLDIDAHSMLATQGGDLTPELNIAWGITEEWWIGGNVGGVISTDPDEGDKHGYPYATCWVTWLCGLLPNESDSLSLSIWAASNEQRDVDHALFIGLEYEFDLTDSIDATIGLGTDPSSPWDRVGLYATAALTWRF